MRQSCDWTGHWNMGRRERLFLHVHMVAMPLFTSQKLCEISSDASEQPETWQKCTCISQISVLVSFCKEEFAIVK